MSAINLTSLSKEEFRKFVDSFDTVLADCDGMYCECIFIFINC